MVQYYGYRRYRNNNYYARQAGYYRAARSRAAYRARAIAMQGKGGYTAPKRASSARRAYGTMKGRGGYYDSKFVKTMKEYIPEGSFKAIGGATAGILGQLAGAALGKIAGFGEYDIKSNSIATKISEGESPASMHSGNSSLKIRHREYVTDIISSSSANTFSLQSFPINPGLIQSFPWLSSIAQQYEEHKPLGVVYEFKSLSADAIASSTNNTLGGIIMATDYNSINANFVNKQQMDNTEYTTSSKPSCSFYHPIECDPRTNPISTLYIRSGSAPSGSDLRLYDLGNFQIASFGIQGTNVVLGELWCTYEWEFRKPISTTALGQDVLSDHFESTSGTSAAPLLGCVAVANSSIGGTITSGTTYNFPPTFQEGTYLIIAYWVGNTGASIGYPTITTTNCTKLTIWNVDSQSSLLSPLNAVTSTVATQAFMIKITGQNATIAWSTGGTLPTTLTSTDLFVTEFDSNITT